MIQDYTEVSEHDFKDYMMDKIFKIVDSVNFRLIILLIYKSRNCLQTINNS